MKIIDNTSSGGVLLKEFINRDYPDKLELFHNMILLSSYYDFIIDNRQIVVCDKEIFDK